MQWRTKYYYFKTSSKLDVQLSTLFILCPFWRSMGKLTQPFNGPLPVSTCNLQCCTQQTGQKRVMICHNRLRRIGAKPPVDDLAGQWETVGTPVAHNSPPVTWKTQEHRKDTFRRRSTEGFEEITDMGFYAQIFSTKLPSLSRTGL